MRHMSKKGIKLLKSWEGISLSPYRDKANYWTIGVGHLITKSEWNLEYIEIDGKNVEFSNGLTMEQALLLFSQDLEKYEKAVYRLLVEPMNLTQDQFDSLISFTFNVGITAFRKSTLLKRIDQKDWKDIPVQFRRWNRAGGKVVQRRINRRENEIKLWNGEL